jgi:hypothetical protein
MGKREVSWIEVSFELVGEFNIAILRFLGKCLALGKLKAS